ncbi:MAG: MucR family transcriptional regulator [Pseudomonadota bacterium]
MSRDRDRTRDIELLGLTTEVVSSRIVNSDLSSEDISKMIKKIYATMQEITNTETVNTPTAQTPYVPVHESIKPDYIICLEDGRKMKMLRRHLKTAYNMSPEEYREKWNLPPDYPMTAPNYAKRRSALAKKIGLGKSSR